MTNNSTLPNSDAKPDDIIAGKESMDEKRLQKSKAGLKVKAKVSRTKRKLFKHVWVVRAALLVGVVLSFYALFFVFRLVANNLELSKYSKFAQNFIFAPTYLLNSSQGKTNILVMGKAGGEHDGADLTDTMLLITLTVDSPKVTIVSIPRDIWIPEIRAKINSAYYWGNQKMEGGGLSLAESSVEEIVGSTVQYGAVIDFSGFKNIVDVLGGVEVNVEEGFIDNEYPIQGKENDLCDGDREYKCRYETVKFDEGLQTMDGETALKFVRSRHAEGDQGTDIARGARQQEVVEAIKNKILVPKTLLNFKKMKALINVTKNSIETDIDPSSGAVIARKFYDARNEIGRNLIPEEFLENPPISPVYDKQYVFIPKAGNGNWEDIHAWFDKLTTY